MKTLLRVFARILSFNISNTLKEIDKKGKIVCLYSHNPSRKGFEDLTIWFLRNNFSFVTTESLIEIVNGQKIIKRPIWVSFDDGWRDNFTNILPTLEKYKVPATFFISTKPVETGTFWWTKARRNKELLRVKNPDDLWDIPNTARKEQLEQISENDNIRETLTISELQTLAKCKYVTIGNHTDDHVNCLNCSEHELVEDIEIANNKIKNWTGISPKYFAYPGGRRNKNIIRLIRQLDFKLGASIEQRLGASEDDIYDFPRTCIKDNAVSLTENLVMALGLRQKYVTYLRKIFKTI